jgi:hypothetical protein
MQKLDHSNEKDSKFQHIGIFLAENRFVMVLKSGLLRQRKFRSFYILFQYVAVVRPPFPDSYRKVWTSFIIYVILQNKCLLLSRRPPVERVGLGFSAIGGKRHRNDSAQDGSGVTGCKAPGLKTPNKHVGWNHKKSVGSSDKSG